jgi:hypothetical protein
VLLRVHEVPADSAHGSRGRHNTRDLQAPEVHQQRQLDHDKAPVAGTAPAQRRHRRLPDRVQESRHPQCEHQQRADINTMPIMNMQANRYVSLSPPPPHTAQDDSGLHDPRQIQRRRLLVHPTESSTGQLLGEGAGDEFRGQRRLHGDQVLRHSGVESRDAVLEGDADRRALHRLHPRRLPLRRLLLQEEVHAQRTEYEAHSDRQPGLRQHRLHTRRVGGAPQEDPAAQGARQRLLRHGLRGHRQGCRQGQARDALRRQDRQRERHRPGEDRVPQRGLGHEVRATRLYHLHILSLRFFPPFFPAVRPFKSSINYLQIFVNNK